MIDALITFDHSVILFVQESISNSIAIGISNFFTFLGYYGIIWILLLSLFSIRRKDRILLLSWSITFFIIFIVLELALKNIVHRDRPYVEYPWIIINTFKPSSFSFPSAHAAFSGAAFYLFMKFSTKRTFTVLIFLLSLAISVSRILLKVHYPTDVIAGYLLGFIIAFFTVTCIVSIKK
jgi:undecaprenyl-diphosphatase